MSLKKRHLNKIKADREKSIYYPDRPPLYKWTDEEIIKEWERVEKAALRRNPTRMSILQYSTICTELEMRKLKIKLRKDIFFT